jgi:hypothetical protein
MGELAILLVGKGIQESRRNRTVKNEIALEQVDPFKGLESSRLSWRRLSASNIWTLVIYRIDIRTIGIVFNVGILKVRRSMAIIVDTKISLKRGKESTLNCLCRLRIHRSRVFLASLDVPQTWDAESEGML